MPVLVLGLLALSWVVPDHIPPWFMFHTEIPAFAASGICIFACLQWSKGRILVPNAALGFGLLLCTVFLQWTLGVIVYAGDAWVASAYILLAASGWFWGCQWTRRVGPASALTTVAFFLMAVGLITTFQLVAQGLKIEDVFGGAVLNGLSDGRPRANLGQSNQAATTVMLAVVATALLCARKNISLLIAGVLELLFLLAISFTQSRTALISGVILMVALVYSHARKGANRRLALVLFSLFLVGASLLYFSWSVNRTSISSVAAVAIDSRSLIWRQLIAAIREHPWMGWGWLQVASAQQFGAIQFPGVGLVNYSHNIILDALVMLGIPATLVLTAVTLLGVKSRWREASQSSEVIWAIALTIPFWVHSFFELPHAYAYFLFPVAVLLGLIDACTEKKTNHTLYFSTQRAVYVGIVWTSLLLVMGYEYLQIEDEFRVSRFENRRVGPLNSLHRDNNIVLFTQLAELERAPRIQIGPEMNLEDVEVLKRVATRYTSSSLELRAAIALALNDRLSEADERMQVIKNLFTADIYVEATREFSVSQKK